jgi:hypothetical protein
LGEIGRDWERLGEIGRDWERLGEIGRYWERLGAIGRDGERLGERWREDASGGVMSRAIEGRGNARQRGKTKQQSKVEVEMNGDVFEFVRVLEELDLKGNLGTTV